MAVRIYSDWDMGKKGISWKFWGLHRFLIPLRLIQGAFVDPLMGC
jgi:hypothetical protein